MLGAPTGLLPLIGYPRTLDGLAALNELTAAKWTSDTDKENENVNHATLRDLDVSRIGLGAMGMSFGYTGAGTDDAGSIRTIHRALDLGVTFIARVRAGEGRYRAVVAA